MAVKRAIAVALTILFIFAVIVSVAYADYAGTINIPSINCKFDLSFFNSHANAHQHIAQLYKQQGCIVVGNHYASASESGGLWKLENLTVGDKAYLEYTTMDGLEAVYHKNSYVCYAIFLADAGAVFSHNGIEVKPYAETDLICCTCVGHDSTRNYVAFFEVMK